MAAVERTKLYRQVWSIPGSQLAIMYGISDVGLAKACKRYAIPRPPRGYWARRAVGQKIRRPPLPKANEHLKIVHLKGWNMTDAAIQGFAVEQRGATPAEAGSQVDATPHKLVMATRTHVSGLKPDREGLIRTDGRVALNLRISPPLIDRCLHVMDLIIKRWDTKGGAVSVGTGEDGKQTAFAIGPDGFCIEVVEAVDEAKPLTDPTRLSGRLTIFIRGDERRDFRRRWADTKTQRLERMINPLIETLSTVLAVIKAERIDAECVQRQKQKLDAHRKAEASRASREFYWRQELMESVNRWHAAQQIRAYLDDLVRSVEDGRSRINDEAAFKRWTEWSQRYADSIDPIMNSPMPSESIGGPKNTPVEELDLTTYTAPALAQLKIKDTDQLARVTSEQIRALGGCHISDVWSEITRVLGGLGYAISKRREVYW